MTVFIDSIDDLSAHVDVPPFELHRILRNPTEYYKTFRLQKKSGGHRRISAPAETLKAVQRWIGGKMLAPYSVHEACTGYRRGFSIVDNARMHTGKDWVFNADIEQFFPSIGKRRVEQLMQSLGYCPRFAGQLAQLTTFNNELPQGAPSSPVIANLICRSLDARLQQLALQRGWNYTRYCDDITFSGAGRLSTRDERLIRCIIEEEQFRVNEDKVRLARKHRRQTVTGLVVNSFPNVERKTRRRIRAMLHQHLTNTSSPGDVESDNVSVQVDREKLRGHLSFVKMVRGYFSGVFSGNNSEDR